MAGKRCRCSHCGKVRVTYQWTLKACADQRKKRTHRLCGPCDVELNRIVLAFFRDPKVNEKIAAYRSA